MERHAIAAVIAKADPSMNLYSRLPSPDWFNMAQQQLLAHGTVSGLLLANISPNKPFRSQWLEPIDLLEPRICSIETLETRPHLRFAQVSHLGWAKNPMTDTQSTQLLIEKLKYPGLT
ncbi:hypothetical protein [Hoeflea poritis]|uniref:Uncharacterized protein n=1 Tax=Hoeflea poritis TaxID=2993659 RepID=A0ABT4VVW2_9HYPH|nr:hypothetical protein [Hoeflea poritis]MDA4848854.1 hypothetical protein [Hoeflea poritis]